MTTINTVIVDHNTLFVEGLKALFSDITVPKLNIVAHLKEGKNIRQQLSGKLDIDLVIMELNLPDQDGLEIIPTITKYYSDARICVLSSFGHYKYVKEAFLKGIDGYILKSNEIDDLRNGILQIMEGETYLGPGLRITPPNGKSLTTEPNRYQDRFTIKRKLTPREQEILTLIAQAKNNKEIGKELFISDQTVGVHRKNIMRKLGVHNTVNLIKVALEKRLV